MPPITRIADLPFRSLEPRELLRLESHREDLDLDYTGYGWCRVGSILLAEHEGGRRRVDDVLLLGLHAAESGAALPDDVELEFYVDETSVFTALLSTFLSVWLPRISGRERAVVLALCNPHRAALRRPPGCPPLHYGIGDVDSWLDERGAGFDLRLVADAWKIAA